MTKSEDKERVFARIHCWSLSSFSLQLQTKVSTEGSAREHVYVAAYSICAGHIQFFFFLQEMIKEPVDCRSSSNSSYSMCSAITRVMRSSKGAGSGALFGIHSGFAIYHLCDLEQITPRLCAST